MTQDADTPAPEPQEAGAFSIAEVRVELRRLYRSSEDERVKLRCLELSAELCPEVDAAAVSDPMRRAMLKIKNGT